SRPRAEVAAFLRRCGNLSHTNAAYDAAPALIAGEEKCPVAAIVQFREIDRASHHSAELILLEWSFRVEARIVFLQNVIAEKVESGAVNLVRAGFHGDAHLANSHAELGRIERVLQLELLDSFDRWNLAGKLEERLVQGYPVDQVGDRGRAGAVD